MFTFDSILATYPAHINLLYLAFLIILGDTKYEVLHCETTTQMYYVFLYFLYDPIKVPVFFLFPMCRNKINLSIDFVIMPLL